MILHSIGYGLIGWVISAEIMSIYREDTDSNIIAGLLIGLGILLITL